MTREAIHPTTRAPIACALTGRDAADRQRWLAATMRQARAVWGEPGGLAAHFDAADELERELRAIAAAEAECCPFLQIEVTRSDEQLHLKITGPPEAQPLITDMFKAAHAR